MTVKVQTETVVFRDKSTVLVSESNWTIASALTRLEAAAETTKIDTPEDDPNYADHMILHRHIYPKLAACTVSVKGSKVPTEREARDMPSAELDKWFMVARKLNPSWFLTSDEVEGQTTEKKRRKRARSS